jgi:uncharacterized OB-fold protein
MDNYFCWKQKQVGYNVKCFKFLSNINQIWTFSTDYHKSSKWNFMKIRPVVAAMAQADREENIRMDVREVIWTISRLSNPA